MTTHRTSRPIAALLLALLAALGLGVTGCEPASEVVSPPTAASALQGTDSGVTAEEGAAGAAAAPDAVRYPAIGFRGRNALGEHFAKHGSEFGAATQRDYLVLAQALRDAPAGGDIVEAHRADGVICRFDRATGAFLAFNDDLTIRTCFKPNDGEAYFSRQLEREH